MKRFFFIVPVVASLMLCGTSASATTISYDANNIGGNTWEYSYTVENDTLSQDIEELTIFFEYGLYANLTVTSPVADWDELTVEPVEILGSPQDGFYDALALVSGIAPGSSMGGFSLSFDWLGAGTPGGQYFESVDPLTFSAVDSGITTAAQSQSVPEPGTLLLLGSGGLAFVGFRKRFFSKK